MLHGHMLGGMSYGTLDVEYLKYNCRRIVILPFNARDFSKINKDLKLASAYSCYDSHNVLVEMSVNFFGSFLDNLILNVYNFTRRLV